jgi:hypothetical protein
MNNVINVDFGKNSIGVQTGDSGLTAYLDSLRKQGVDDEDILEVIDAIQDVSCYFLADDEVKAFADGWLSQFL